MTNQTKLIPTKYLKKDGTNATSFSLLKFIACIVMACRKKNPKVKLSSTETSLLHVLILRGWSEGEFRHFQSVMALYTGLCIKTVGLNLASLEGKGFIRRVTSRRRGTTFTLLENAVTQLARNYFLDDKLYGQVEDDCVSDLWGTKPATLAGTKTTAIVSGTTIQVSNVPDSDGDDKEGRSPQSEVPVAESIDSNPSDRALDDEKVKELVSELRASQSTGSQVSGNSVPGAQEVIEPDFVDNLINQDEPLDE